MIERLSIKTVMIKLPNKPAIEPSMLIAPSVPGGTGFKVVIRKVPEGILLSIGLNDTARIGRKDGRPQLFEDAFKFGLKQLVNEIKNEVHIMVLGLTPVNEDSMPFAECLW